MKLSSTRWTAIGPAPVDTPTKALGHTVGRIDAAAPDPGNVDAMCVGSAGGGVWKTGVWTRSDPVWLVLTDDQPSINVAGFHSLVVHPSHHGTVFGLVSGPGAGVLKSTNFGIDWQLLGNDLFEGAALHSIAVDPSDVDTLYVAVYSGGTFFGAGVYKTTNGGAQWNKLPIDHAGDISDVIIAKWNRLETGLPSGFFVGGAIRLESATEKDRVYVTLFQIEGFNGSTQVSRFRSIDGGDHWKILAATPGTPELRAWHV